VSTTTAPAAGRRRQLNGWARRLAWATVAYNALEGVIAVAAGAVAGSVALVSFGLDSAIEVASALVITWQFARRHPEYAERRALRLIAVSFFALAAYVTVDAIRNLVGTAEPSPSVVGIVLTAVSLVAMPGLAYAKRRIGKILGSATVIADSTQTLICSYLSAIVLAGLVLNQTLGWNWADPVAALVVAVVATREGVQVWRGDACCAPAGAPGTCADDSCCSTEER
jgi:divalent metal cation (Fe/Co/Zn/Cd) transporter